jgi:homospermidine synthase
VNATLTQVGSGVYAAISYLIENPHLGLISPEEIDPHYALNLVTPYLGRCDFIETTALYKPEGDTLYDLMVVPNKNLLSWEKVVVKEAQLV